MYTNTFKNELTTDQKGKLLLNTCGILFYCRNSAKITAIKRMQPVQGSLLWFLFCLILFLTSQSTIFVVFFFFACVFVFVRFGGGGGGG